MIEHGTMIKRNRNLFLVVTGFLVFFLVLQLAGSRPPQYYLNLSKSMPLGVYKLIPFDGDLKTGESVILEVPEPARPYIYGRGWLPQGWLLIKTVGALPGDKVTITDDAIKIKDVYIGPVFDTDTEVRPLPRLRGSINIPEKHFLPIATYIRNSFDGRYFGPVPFDLIRGKAVPVITF